METHAAIVERVRGDDLGLIGFEIGGADDAAAGLQIGDERGRDLALVEVAPARCGEAPIGRRQLLVAQITPRAVACRNRRHAVGEKHGLRARKLLERPRLDRDLQHAVPVDRQTLLGKADRRRHDLGQLLAAEASRGRGTSPSTEPGTQIELVALEVAVAFDERPAEELGADPACHLVARGIELRRCDEAEIDDLHLAAIGVAEDEIAGAAERRSSRARRRRARRRSQQRRRRHCRRTPESRPRPRPQPRAGPRRRRPPTLLPVWSESSFLPDVAWRASSRPDMSRRHLPPCGNPLQAVNL